MPYKGMRSFCFSPKREPSSSSSSNFPSSPLRSGLSTPRLSFSNAVMDRTLEMCGAIIMKWDPDGSTFAKVTSLFYENRREARDFIRSVNNLQKAMQFLVAEESNSEKLIRGQNLMQMAMKRLQKEFYQILSLNRAQLDPESVSTRSSRASTLSSTSDYEDDDAQEDDVLRVTTGSISEVEDVSTVVMTDLRLIAECMISSGYGKECVKIYKIIRKSIVDEGIYRLGVEKISSSQVHKMDWEVLDLRIKNWLNAVNLAVKTLLSGERILCDHVFAASESIRENCFTDITKEGAMILFGFPENVARNRKKSSEKVFRLLDMYTAIADSWQEIESIFSFDSTSTIRSQAVTALIKLGESVRTGLAEFESSLQKDSSKSLVAGSGIHHLTLDVMSYLSLLADYSNILADILTDSLPPSKTSLPESYFDVSVYDDSPASTVSFRFAWLILVLLCKLDGKAKNYKDVSFSYLFLANNLNYVVSKVRTSNIKYLLGDDWISKHEAKVQQFALNYERLGWGEVQKSIPEDPTALNSPEEVKECFKKFNSSFEQAHRKQSVCVVLDSKLREDIKLSICRKVMRAYREFYNTHKLTVGRERYLTSVVRYTPEDVGNYLSDLFFESVMLENSPSASSSSSRSRPLSFFFQN